MKPLTVVLLSVVISTASAGVVVSLLQPTPVAGQTVREEPRTPSYEELENRLAAQEELLRDLSVKLELRSPRKADVTRQEDLETVVRRVMESERQKEVAVVRSVDPALAAFDPAAARDELLDLERSGAGYDAVEGFWKRIRSEGRMDEVVAAFEEYAQALPNDPEAQIDLGNAYLQRLQDATTGPEMGQWAIKADGAFDNALTLDESNWEARFSKAVALSFWPPIFGKQGEAIGQFEILLQQQVGVPPESDHAQTYLYLGNLYQQQGDADKAHQIWEQGYAAFPDDSMLADKLAEAEAN